MNTYNPKKLFELYENGLITDEVLAYYLTLNANQKKEENQWQENHDKLAQLNRYKSALMKDKWAKKLSDEQANKKQIADRNFLLNLKNSKGDAVYSYEDILSMSDYEVWSLAEKIRNSKFALLNEQEIIMFTETGPNDNPFIMPEEEINPRYEAYVKGTDLYFEDTNKESRTRK